jgi:hypothetical protein
MAGFVQAKETPPLDGMPSGNNLIPSAVYTATGSCEFAAPLGCQMAEIHYKQTAGTAAQSLVLSIDGFNEQDGTWEQLIVSAALVSATTDDKFVQVNPMTPAVTNISSQRVVRRRLRATVTHADSKSVTYAVDVHVQ